MTEMLFRDNPYAQEAPGTVVEITDQGGIVLDQTVFYPTSGGQPGDQGWLSFSGQDIEIMTTLKGDLDQIILVPASGCQLPKVGNAVRQRLDWDRRYAHMRLHTALHLLSVVIPLPVTGGQIGAEKARLDFAMPDPIEDKAALETELNALISQDLEVTVTWITDAELEANPSLVKTMSVQPPRGAGQIRLVRIGTPETKVDLQPCGGTHVLRTGEIGQVRLGKVEKKGRVNRRVALHLV